MRLVVTTCKPDEAELIADTLLAEGLIASCNIIPRVTTKVRWKGENITQPESLLIMRTRAELIWKLEPRIVELNSFEVPEVASIDIKEWNPAYFNWIYKATEDPENIRD